MSAHQFPIADTPAINFAAVALVARKLASAVHPAFPARRADYLHIAEDCEAAERGCAASAESVAEFIVGEHQLEMAADSLAVLS